MTWLLFALIGLGSLLLRTSFILHVDPAHAERIGSTRRFIPVAALTALVIPALLPRSGEPAYARAIAALAACAIAFRFKNTFATVVAGVLILVLLR